MRRQGFTIIELAVTVMILSVIAGGVALRIHAPLRATQARDAVARLADLDAETRRMARRQDKAIDLVFDANRIQRMDRTVNEPIGPSVRLPSWCQIESVQFPARPADVARVVVPYSRGGHAPTYTVHLLPGKKQHRWVLCCGLTGEARSFDEKSQLQNLLDATGLGSDAR